MHQLNGFGEGLRVGEEALELREGLLEHHNRPGSRDGVGVQAGSHGGLRSIGGVGVVAPAQVAHAARWADERVGGWKAGAGG